MGLILNGRRIDMSITIIPKNKQAMKHFTKEMVKLLEDITLALPNKKTFTKQEIDDAISKVIKDKYKEDLA